MVFVAKHHDGFLLWPSRHPNPRIAGYQVSRDVIGELADAVRRRGMRFGLYYSGGLDWAWDDSLITDIPSMFRCIGQSPEYVEYVDAHWRELIERYRPDILWGDIGYPAAADLERLFADYYNAVPDGLINDRFAQELPDSMDPSETRDPAHQRALRLHHPRVQQLRDGDRLRVGVHAWHRARLRLQPQRDGGDTRHIGRAHRLTDRRHQQEREPPARDRAHGRWHDPVGTAEPLEGWVGGSRATARPSTARGRGPVRRPRPTTVSMSTSPRGRTPST